MGNYVRHDHHHPLARRGGPVSLARPLTVTVLSTSGEVLGTVTTKPVNTGWLLNKGIPRVLLQRPVRDCERHGIGWAVRLREGEKPPRKMVKP